MKRSDERIPNVSELRSFVRNGAIRISHIGGGSKVQNPNRICVDKRRLLKIGVNFQRNAALTDGK